VRTSRRPASTLDEPTGRSPEGAPGPDDDGPLGRLSGRLASFASPPWLKSPLLLFRFPRLLVAMGGAVFVLALVTASSPLFLSSAGNRTLSNAIGPACPWDVGMTFQSPLAMLREPGRFGQGPSASADEALREAEATINDFTHDIPGLGPVERFGIGASVEASKQGGTAVSPVRLVYRTGALSHVTKIASAGGAGMWLAASTARAIGARPGDTITLGSSSVGSASVRVAGTYRDLISQPRTAFWCQQEHYIYPLGAFANYLPPPFAIVDRQAFFPLEEQLKDTSPVLTWEREVPPGITLPEAEQLSGRLLAMLALGPAFRTEVTHLPFLAEDARATVESMRGPVDTIAVAGRIVALGVIVVAGMLWLERRRSEVRLLAVKGAGPASVGTKVVLEVLLPAAGAAVIGVLAARWLVRLLGPTSVIDASAESSANRQVLGTSVFALLVLGGVTALVSRRVLEATTGQGRRDAVTRYPWEVAVLALAGAAFYEITTRGTAPVQSGTQIPKVDRFLLLFPILFTLGGAGLLVRGLQRILPVLRSRGGRWSASLYLASRRLVEASRTAFALVVAAAVAIGILLYAGTLSASVSATGEAKALVFTGGRTAVTFQSQVSDPPATSFRSTLVRRIERGVAGNGDGGLDIMGIDRRTFGSTAFWDPSFAGSSLADLLQRLTPGAPGTAVPVVVTGAPNLPPETTVSFPGSGTQPIPIRVVERVVAFPGMRAGSPLVVMDRDALVSLSKIGIDVLWARAPRAAVLAVANRNRLPVLRTVTTAEVQTTPQFLTLSWTFGFLQALGILTGLVALGGAVMYLEARQRSRKVSYALSRRMGLARRSHRWSIALELGAILVASLVIGGLLAAVAARMVYSKLDPIPSIPPAPLLRQPLALLGASVVVVLVASWIGAWRVQRAADRARVAEVMRLAD
jgi:putative ABC transport system permease protein